MSINDTELKDFENNCKSTYFEPIGYLTSAVKLFLSKLSTISQYIPLESDLPNIGITLNNKVVELARQFQDAGVSIYYQELNGQLTTSFLGTAVVSDLISNANIAIENLDSFDSLLSMLMDKKLEQKHKLEKSNPFVKLTRKIANLFVPLDLYDFSFTPAETSALNAHLLGYKDMDDKLFNYNIRDNIIPCIVSQMEDNHMSGSSLTEALQSYVYPYLEKLGLADLIPKLDEALAVSRDTHNNSFKQDLKNNGVISTPNQVNVEEEPVSTDGPSLD